MISLGQKLNLRVIAEGVETDEQVAFLRENNCDEMQGYHFSKPLPAADIEQMLRARPAVLTERRRLARLVARPPAAGLRPACACLTMRRHAGEPDRLVSTSVRFRDRRGRRGGAFARRGAESRRWDAGAPSWSSIPTRRRARGPRSGQRDRRRDRAGCFERIGAWEAIAPLAQPILQMAIMDGARRATPSARSRCASTRSTASRSPTWR